MSDESEKRMRGKRGDGCLVLRKTGWYLRVYDANGRQYARATKTHDKKKAQRMLDRELEKRAHAENPDAHKVTFAELVDDLLTDYRVNNRRSVPKLKHLQEHFGKTRALNITSAAIRKYEDDRLTA